MSRPLAAALGLSCIIAVTVGGCGFHLRTLNLGTSLQSFYVQAPSGDEFAAPLRNALLQAGVKEAASAAAAQAVIDLLDGQRERRSVSVTGQARVAEYEMNLGVQYRVLDGAGNELIAPRWVRSARVYRVDRDNIVGSNEEQALLEREMRNDLIAQIVRALDAVTGTAHAG